MPWLCQDIPGGNRTLSSVFVRAEGVGAVQAQVLEQPLAAFPVTRRCQRSWKWRKDSLSISCCRCQGSRQDGQAAPASPCLHGNHGRVPAGEGSALPGCHTDTAGAPGIYTWINFSPNPAVGRSALEQNGFALRGSGTWVSERWPRFYLHASPDGAPR